MLHVRLVGVDTQLGVNVVGQLQLANLRKHHRFSLFNAELNPNHGFNEEHHGFTHLQCG